MGPQDVSRIFLPSLYPLLGIWLYYSEVPYKDTSFFVNAYVALINALALLNGQPSGLVSYVDAVLVMHLHGISHSDYYYGSTYGLVWLWTASAMCMGFWVLLLYEFVEQRQIQRIIPTFPTGPIPTHKVHTPGRSMLPPSKLRQKIK